MMPENQRKTPKFRRLKIFVTKKDNNSNTFNNNNNQEKQNKKNDLPKINCLLLGFSSLGSPTCVNHRILYSPWVFGCPLFKLRHEISRCNNIIRRHLWDLSVACKQKKYSPLTLETFQKNYENNYYKEGNRYIKKIISNILENLEKIELLKKQLDESDEKLQQKKNSTQNQIIKIKESETLKLSNQSQLLELVEKELLKETNFQKTHPHLPILQNCLGPHEIEEILKEIERLKIDLTQNQTSFNDEVFKKLEIIFKKLITYNSNRQKQIKEYQQQEQ